MLEPDGAQRATSSRRRISLFGTGLGRNARIERRLSTASSTSAPGRSTPGSVSARRRAVAAVSGGIRFAISFILASIVLIARGRRQLAAPFDPVEAGAARVALEHHLGRAAADQR